MHRRFPVWILLAITAVTSATSLRAAAPAVAPVASPYELKVVTDRPDALYSAGEKVKFLITLTKDKQPVTQGQVTYLLSKDGVAPKSGKVTLTADPAVVEGTLGEPGFLRCQAVYSCGPKQSVTALAGAGFDPLKIAPSMPVPDDFDAFWSAQKAKLAAVPMTPTLTPVAWKDTRVKCFDVQVPCLGPRPVSGYFARPSDAKPKSLPAILYVHGAGVRSSSLGAAAGAAAMPALGMDINAHGLPNGKPDEFYEKLRQGELSGYPAFGRDSRETSYFLGMFLRLMRAMDFLTSQPEWDGKTLVVTGSSQGGGQSIAAAGLNPRVTFIAAGVPAICDHSGQAAGRINGWPKLVPTEKDGKPEPKALQAARYFDCMNLATRAKADAIFSVGFIDTTCPATSVYATYNNLPNKKQIINEPLMGHRSTPAISKAFQAAISQHIAQMKERQ